MGYKEVYLFCDISICFDDCDPVSSIDFVELTSIELDIGNFSTSSIEVSSIGSSIDFDRIMIA